MNPFWDATMIYDLLVCSWPSKDQASYIPPDNHANWSTYVLEPGHNLIQNIEL